MSRIVAMVAMVLVLVVVNIAVINKETLLDEGRVIYLELAPVDPRSLMQGDYMALRFALAEALLPVVKKADSSDGKVVVVPNGRGVVTAVQRLADGRPLEAGELELQYRLRRGQLLFATNAFFFQEGQGEHYATARYGEFRVGSAGEMILTGLCDGALNRLAPPAPHF